MEDRRGIAHETVRQGRGLGSILTGLITRGAEIAAVARISERFLLIDLAGENLRRPGWEPGQKLQIIMNGILEARAFTPLEWDAANGRTRLLCWAHGDTVGAHWARGAEAGMSCRVFGPRAAFRADMAGKAICIFGDETSIAVAAALSGRAFTKVAGFLMETSAPVESDAACAAVGVQPAAMLEKREDMGHLEEIADLAKAQIDAGCHIVLTGQAASIQRISRQLRMLDVPRSRIISKVHWAEGRKGLD